MVCDPQQPELQHPDAIFLLHIKGSSISSFTRSTAVTLLPVEKRAACVDRLESAPFLSPTFSQPKGAEPAAMQLDSTPIWWRRNGDGMPVKAFYWERARQ